ncbi:MAG: GXGXG motif-containing protein, partial [Alphaproteobacteria bacterium]|nr:GXGXG motif-containing protein [Alphaproteobacteria bacterium]
MAGVSDTEDRSYDMGMHTEQLSGRTQQIFFSPADDENFVYPWAPDVDFNKRAELDVADMTPNEINKSLKG